MQYSRRSFLKTTGLTVTSGALFRGISFKSELNLKAANWESIRDEFPLSRDYIHMSHFFLTSHPTKVSNAIAQFKAAIDANPFMAVDPQFQGPNYRRVLEALGRYTGGKSEEIALTHSTTMGLSLIYHGLKIKPEQEILTTSHDHYSHHESIRLAALRTGASIRKISLFDKPENANTGDILERIRIGIKPQTRILGITWVHTSSGLKLPLKEISSLIKTTNENREPDNRIIIVLDAVHGFGVEDVRIAETGVDFAAAGTHKWLFGPRGTGFIWAKESSWRLLNPVVPTFYNEEPFIAWQEKHLPIGDTRADHVSPGGFTAFEHQWAIADAVEFHEEVGMFRVSDRVHELNTLCKSGLSEIRNVRILTPMSTDLSSGIIVFEIEGQKTEDVVAGLLNEKVIASGSPYLPSYPRLSPSLVTLEADVETSIDAIRKVASRSRL